MNDVLLVQVREAAEQLVSNVTHLFLRHQFTLVFVHLTAEHVPQQTSITKLLRNDVKVTIIVQKLKNAYN